MTARKNQPLDPVQRAAHYNSHPSGVEAIDVVEDLPFNLGNAWKYVQRADEKGATLQDLEKALWYIRREAHRHRILARSKRLPREVKVRSSVEILVRRYLRHEGGLRRDFFAHVWGAYVAGSREGGNGSLPHLAQAELLLSQVIREKKEVRS